MKLEFYRQILDKKLKYQVSSKSVQCEPNCTMRTEGQTDMKSIVAFRTFANVPINGTSSLIKTGPDTKGSYTEKKCCQKYTKVLCICSYAFRTECTLASVRWIH